MPASRPVLRRLAVAVLPIGLGMGLVVGGATVANAAPLAATALVATTTPSAAPSDAASASPSSGSASPSPSGSASTKPARGTLRALVRALPKSLRTDLAKLRKDSPTARKAALTAIEQKAVAGGYGTEVQTVATKLQSDWATAPTSFKRAVQGLHEGTRHERAAQLRMIYRRALAGKYGAAIQQDAQQVQTMLAASGSTGS